MLYKESEIEEMAPWLVVIITLIGGLIRIYLLASKGLWLDETFSIWMAHHSIGDIVQWTMRIDQHPPLYYFLLHYWVALTGDTAYNVRLLSVLIGTGTIPVIYLIGKRIAGAMAGVAAAVFLAFSIFNIYYAQETRMYTLLAFNAAVAMYALARLLTDPRAATRPIGSQFREYLHAWRTQGPLQPDREAYFSYRDMTRYQSGWRAWLFNHRWSPIQTIETDLTWAAFMVFSALTLLSHNTAVFFIFAANVFVFGLLLYQRSRPNGPLPALQAPSLGNWLKAQIGIFLLWSPWLPAFIQQASRVDREFWIPRPSWDAVVQTLRFFLNPAGPGLSSQIMTWALCGLLCLGLVFFRKKLSAFVFLVTLFAVPFLGELAVSIRRPIFYDRTLIWITIPLCLVLAAGIAQFRYQLLVFAALGIIGLYYLGTTDGYYRYVQKEDWKDPAGYVANRFEKGDVVLFNSAMTQIAFDYYLEDIAEKLDLQMEQHGVPDMLDSRIQEPIMTESDIPRLISLVREHQRVWLVYSHDSYTDPQGLVPKTIAGEMGLINEREFFGGKVLLYGNGTP